MIYDCYCYCLQVTEELAYIIELLRSKQSVGDKAIALGGLGLVNEEWEAAPVIRSIEYLGEAFTAGLEAQIQAHRRLTSDGKSDIEIREMFNLIDEDGGGTLYTNTN